MEKHCNLCGQDKPTTAFFADRSRPDGLTPYCADCIRSRNAMRKGKQERRVKAPDGFTYCSACKETKPNALFGFGNRYPDGLSRHCLACQNDRHLKWLEKHPGYRNEKSREWRAKNPERHRDHQYKSSYGLSYGQYGALLSQQDGQCAICKTERPGGRGRFHVDHNHETGRVRGLLCHSCNVALGHFRHDPKVLTQALDYLAEGQGER